MDIQISEEIKKVCPQICLGIIICDVENNGFNSELCKEIEGYAEIFRQQYPMEEIKNRPPIRATREVYKKLGKDPNRYRPSAEALSRRIAKGMKLYQIDTLVDLINLVSLKTGYSIGGFDLDKIKGETLTLGVGRKDETFDAIGRGLLNIEGLPVYRDSAGGIGTPTSDEERTKISSETNKLLMIINAYSGEEGLREAMDFSVNLLKKYANAKAFSQDIIQ